MSNFSLWKTKWKGRSFTTLPKINLYIGANLSGKKAGTVENAKCPIKENNTKI
jgi:hypothetical protein